MEDQEQQDLAKNDVPATAKAAHSDFMKKIIEKIKGSENILVALSKMPTVDEIAAAIGLTIYLDGIQRHVTAIFSGDLPEAVDFLEPEETFEKNTDSLQDFIISLSKDKADHLRYKLEGDEVKVYITPYKTTITKEDLEFSHGDYNVDFVVAMNVPAATDLDEALSDYAKVLRDAAAVNITTGDPGKFGEIEWSDARASSVSEMVTRLVFEMNGDEGDFDVDVATALLAGIVAATDRFSNENTTPETLTLASKLMALGADQQLITANIMGNQLTKPKKEEMKKEDLTAPVDKTNLAVDHTVVQAPVKNPYMNPEKPVVDSGGLPAAPTISTATVGVNSVGANPVTAKISGGGRFLKNEDAGVSGKSTANMASLMAAAGGAGARTEVSPTNPVAVEKPVNPAAAAAKAANTNIEAGPGTFAIPGLNRAAVQTSATPTPDMLNLPGMKGAGIQGINTSAAESLAAKPAARAMASEEPQQATVPQQGVNLQPRAENILPPPPAPPVNGPDAMPPSLPTVQV